MDIAESIIDWYNANKRDLPWRNITDPYSIWVSEIIMQQTRINQGIGYYLNFLTQFPTVFDLAKAEEKQVLLTWQGLGYYSRARNMHVAAKEIVMQWGGQFPNNSKDLLKLKGIGSYTAAAISSICFNENIPAIDGNVIRVISRLFNITDAVNKNSTQKQIENFSIELINNFDAATYNQAMMDLGATICLPKNPICNNCPLADACLAKKNKTFMNIPVKEKKTTPKMRFLVYLVLKTSKHTLIGIRKNNDIWKGLYEFPLIELKKQTSIDAVLKHPMINKFYTKSDGANLKIIEAPQHKLSHQTLYTHFVIITLNELPKINDFQPIEISQLALQPFPRLIEKHLENIFF